VLCPKDEDPWGILEIGELRKENNRVDGKWFRREYDKNGKIFFDGPLLLEVEHRD